MASKKIAKVESAGDIALRIEAEIREATDLDGILGSTTDIADVLDIPLLIEEVETKESDIGELGRFAIVRARDVDGRAIVFTCGGRSILAQLERAQELSLLPFTAKVKMAETAAGFTTYRLAKVPASRG